jgi:hypothetical protein
VELMLTRLVVAPVAKVGAATTRQATSTEKPVARPKWLDLTQDMAHHSRGGGGPSSASSGEPGDVLGVPTIRPDGVPAQRTVM